MIEMYSKTYAVVDLETTGHSPTKGDRIIQIAIVFVRNGEIVNRYMQFVNPEKAIPSFIRHLTNITDADVEKELPFEAIAKEVRMLLEDTVFVAHNTDFDLSFLQSEFNRCGLREWSGEKIDTVELAKVMYPLLPSYRLQDIAEELHISLPSAHRADDDAEATSQLLLACMAKLHTLPEESLQLLHRYSFQLKSNVSSLFYEALKQVRTKHDNKKFDLFRGIPYGKVAKLEERANELLSFPTTTHKKKEMLATVFSRFEERPAQYDFMDSVWKHIREKKEVAIEVPTGVGKTIGYLLPAAIEALQSGKPAIISTYTNYLADRIQKSEMQKLETLLQTTIHVTVIKGQDQYISLGKFEELLRIPEQNYDEQITIMQILIWLTETTTGDLSELNVSGGGQLFLNRIRKQSNHMTEEERRADFHTRLLTRCKDSDFIITNHALLITQLQKEHSFLTNSSALIIDEAHQFAHAASETNKVIFSYPTWKYTMGQLSSESAGQLLSEITRLVTHYSVSGEQLIKRLTDTYQRFAEVFEQVMQKISYYEPDNMNANKGHKVTHPITTIKGIQKELSNVTAALSIYLDHAKQVERALQQFSSHIGEVDQAFVSEWSYWVRELMIKAGEWVDLFFEQSATTHAVWIEKDMRSLPGSLLIIKSPVDITVASRTAINKLQEKNPMGVIWTSGTMSIHNDARYIPKKLGLTEEVQLEVYTAPTHFYEGAEMYVVHDMPEIQEVSQSEYIEEVANAVIETVLATNGKIFVLFTSHFMLRKTYELIEESEQLTEFSLLAQGITPGSRMKLLKSYNQYANAVLFGTNSFWEGIDVQGDALRAVVIVRLPFNAPDEPVFKAKTNQLIAEGVNAFEQYALPEAVMRMRQGFGRLIRSSSDKGFFIVLDRRIETKSYGQFFIESLPPIPIHYSTLSQMANELERYYKE